VPDLQSGKEQYVAEWLERICEARSLDMDEGRL